jgi:APA family basic amino acid/polyamine antiporter
METPAVAPVEAAANQQPTLIRGLSLLDSVLLLVSGIIGSSIFLTAKDIAGPLPQPMLFLGVWVIGGVISLFGCVAFAELGSMFPESGGQYVYLREAYGDLVAFLYGWMLFAVANGGSIAALSVAAAAYTGQVFPAVSQDHARTCSGFCSLPYSPGSMSLACAGVLYCKISPPGPSSPPWGRSSFSGSPSAKATGRTSVRMESASLSACIPRSLSQPWA